MNGAKKIRVAVLFGGRSAEHEVSIESARKILEAIDPARFEATPITVDRDGAWHVGDSTVALGDHPARRSRKVALLRQGGRAEIVAVDDHAPLGAVDVVFPALHGPHGEDGALQGLLELAGVPYVGAGVLGSAIGMDKDVSKRLLREAGIEVAPFRVFVDAGAARKADKAMFATLGPVLFVKPANLGSSVGISRVTTGEQFRDAVDVAFRYDRKIVVEARVAGREIECSVLGNDDPVASVPGEVRPADAFYSYRSKYLDENGAELIIPAELDEDVAEAVRRTAIRSFITLCCAGMARVDMFVDENGRIVVNEINTIPGFTGISMYPKLWEASGLSIRDLVSRLIDLAVERHERCGALSHEYRADGNTTTDG